MKVRLVSSEVICLLRHYSETLLTRITKKQSHALYILKNFNNASKIKVLEDKTIVIKCYKVILDIKHQFKYKMLTHKLEQF